MAESITPTPEENTNTVMKNEFEYKAQLLSALINSMQDEEVSISASMVKDTEAYRKGILEALGVEYTDDDVKHTSVFRSKVIEGVKAMSGGGGSIGSATVIVKNNYRNYATVYFIEVNADGQLKAVSNNMMSGQTMTFNRVAVLGDKILFKTEDGRTMVVTSGSAQMKSNTEAIITGDCSLTITA